MYIRHIQMAIRHRWQMVNGLDNAALVCKGFQTFFCEIITCKTFQNLQLGFVFYKQKSVGEKKNVLKILVELDRIAIIILLFSFNYP